MRSKTCGSQSSNQATARTQRTWLMSERARGGGGGRRAARGEFHSISLALARGPVYYLEGF